MGQFKEVLFMGNGDFSVIEADKLKLRLEEGLILLSAIQQPVHPKSDEHRQALEEERAELKIKLLEVITDIQTALGAEYFQ